MSDDLEIPADDKPSSTWSNAHSRFLTVAEERQRIRAELMAEMVTPRRPVAPEDSEPDPESSEPEDSRRRSRSRRRPAAAAEFTGVMIPLQVKLPSDLVSSLRLLAYDGGVTMSELVQRCLTSPEQVAKCWLQKRSAG